MPAPTDYSGSSLGSHYKASMDRTEALQRLVNVANGLTKEEILEAVGYLRRVKEGHAVSGCNGRVIQIDFNKKPQK